jgi:hypothetical protein
MVKNEEMPGSFKWRSNLNIKPRFLGEKLRRRPSYWQGQVHVGNKTWRTQLTSTICRTYGVEAQKNVRRGAYYHSKSC